MKVLVTGGAGFIGANFVHRVRDDPARLAGDRPGRPDLRRQPREPGRPRRLGPLRRGQHRRRRAGRLAGERHRRGGPLRRGVPQRQLARQPVAVHGVQHHRHLPPAGGGPPPRGAAAPHLDRRGLRRPRAGRPGPVHRADPGQPLQPLLREQGQRRPAGAGVDPLVRRSRPPCPTARTTTGRTSTSRSSSRARSPGSCRASSPSCTAPGPTSATGSTSTTTTTR